LPSTAAPTLIATYWLHPPLVFVVLAALFFPLLKSSAPIRSSDILKLELQVELLLHPFLSASLYLCLSLLGWR
jgi:hypothetical protein